MIPLRIAAIVEGDGEVESLPVLIRRHAEALGMAAVVKVDPVIRQPASKLLQAGDLEKNVELCRRKLGGPGGILVLLDSDDHCPAKLGPRLLGRVQAAVSDRPCSVVLANREYESWFLGAAVSLRGLRGLSPSLEAHPNPETVRGCKEWLTRAMPRGQPYSPILDQREFTKVFDFDAALAACPSFEKCHREIRTLLQRTAAITPGLNPAA